MIINHKHNFIYIRTRKTASTSIEIALSQFSGNECVVTPLLEKDEKVRRSLGFRGTQNGKIPIRHYRSSDFANLLRQVLYKKRLQPLSFSKHNTVSFIKSHVSERIWNSYFKFTFVRNPFDRAVSFYYWRTGKSRPDIGNYLNSTPPHVLSNWNIYTIQDHVAVDFVGRYENLQDDLDNVADQIGLSNGVKLPSAKSGHRPSRAHYSEILSKEARQRIELVCAKEIKKFGYGWKSELR